MKRRTRTIVVLVIAIALASAASFGVYHTVQQIPVRQVEVANYKVVVAAKPLRMGTRLTERDLKLVSWPASSPVATGHSDIRSVVNRGLLASVVENEPLIESKLAPVEAGAGLSPTIPPGMRAMSVKVNEVVGVAGFVVPGTKVDVLVTLRRSQDSMTRTVASNVQVLTAGTRYDQERAKDGQPIPSTVVTLLVTPSDAERIALAQAQGELMLALRNPLDTSEADSQGVRTDSLFGHSAPDPVVRAANSTPSRRVVAAPPVAPPDPPKPPSPYMVESIKAAKRSTEELKEVVR